MKMDVIAYLKNNNIKITVARKNILEIILGSKEAINANLIYTQLKENRKVLWNKPNID